MNLNLNSENLCSFFMICSELVAPSGCPTDFELPLPFSAAWLSSSEQCFLVEEKILAEPLLYLRSLVRFPHGSRYVREFPATACENFTLLRITHGQPPRIMTSLPLCMQFCQTAQLLERSTIFHSLISPYLASPFSVPDSRVPAASVRASRHSQTSPPHRPRERQRRRRTSSLRRPSWHQRFWLAASRGAGHPAPGR